MKNSTKLTIEERNESILLFKELLNKSYKEKNLIGLEEHMIYNVVRGLDMSRGITNIRKNKIALTYYSHYYADSWHYLPTHSKIADFHVKLSKILGYKYDRILQTLPSEVSKLINYNK